MKKNLFVKVTAMCLAATMMVATFGACKKKKKDDAKQQEIMAADSWDGKRIFEIDKDAIDGYTFKVSAYRDFSSDPLNHEYADGAEAFMKAYPGTNVEYLTIGDHQPEKIEAAIASGDVWDVQYVFTCVRHPGDIVDGLYEPLDGYFNLDDPRLDAGALKCAYFDGHYYGVANTVMDEANYFTYNENVFKENGIKTPHEYYAEGNWNIDSFYEICKVLDEKGLSINMSGFGRPDYVLKNATKWNDNFTEVEIVFDSNETRQILDKYRTMIYDWEVESATGGTVTKREVALAADVIPNIMITNNTAETTDTIRYIFFPSNKAEDATPHLYLTDAAFMIPRGSNEETRAAAVELGVYMADARKTYLLDYYKKVMTSEDYDMLLESMNNSQPLPRPFSEFPYQNFHFKQKMLTGTPTATYIAEIKPQLESSADTFNKKLKAYREETGLSKE